MGIHWLPADSIHKGPVIWKVFSCHTVFVEPGWKMSPAISGHICPVPNILAAIPMQWFLISALISIRVLRGTVVLFRTNLGRLLRQQPGYLPYWFMLCASSEATGKELHDIYYNCVSETGFSLTEHYVLLVFTGVGSCLSCNNIELWHVVSYILGFDNDRCVKTAHLLATVENRSLDSNGAGHRSCSDANRPSTTPPVSDRYSNNKDWMMSCAYTYLSSYLGYFREPHWKSIGLPKISRATDVCIQHVREYVKIINISLVLFIHAECFSWRLPFVGYDD